MVFLQFADLLPVVWSGLTRLSKGGLAAGLNHLMNLIREGTCGQTEAPTLTLGGATYLPRSGRPRGSKRAALRIEGPFAAPPG